MVTLLIIVIVVVLLVVLREKREGELTHAFFHRLNDYNYTLFTDNVRLKSNGSMEMDDNVRLKSNGSMEMDDKFDVGFSCIVLVYCYEPCLLLKREYSELPTGGPKQSSLKVSFLTMSCPKYSTNVYALPCSR